MPYPHSPRLFCQIYLDNGTGTYGISHYGRKLIFGVGFGRDDEYCGGPYGEHPKREHICGRPLGLCFSKHIGELYVADAYKGLVVVGPNGGTATGVTSQVEGEPLAFTNSLDIDQRNGAVYFTSSSSKYQRR